MDLVRELLEAKSGELVRQLTGQAGFEEETARQFVPAAGSATLEAMKARAGDLDLGQLASSSNVSVLLDQIDFGALASRVGISTDEAASGLGAILPLILGFLGDKAGGRGGLGGLLDLAGGLGGASDRLKDLGGLFK